VYAAAVAHDRDSRWVLPWIAAWWVACSPSSPGHLDLRILFEGEATPARIELLDAAGKSWIAPDALKVRLECLAAPKPTWLEPLVEFNEIDNIYTGTTQFYSAGHAAIDLPAGDYSVRVFKGNEFRTQRQEFRIDAGQTTRIEFALERWVDPAAEGWLASDDHIHITRLTADDNPWLLAWMEAEGLSVANLLQMGTLDQFDVTPQYAFGDDGVYGEGETRLFSGQEHPRTHLLGHTITLGAREPIDLRETYIDYANVWHESERLGGVSGFAHYGQGPAQDGLSISVPGGRISFVELLQSEYLATRVWYDLLDMGFRIAPSAGTDFPCIPSLPGRERVYVGARALTRESYVAALRAGRTFVTNGPILELRAGESEIGDVLQGQRGQTLRVEGAVHFDPERENVRALELVVDGEVVRVEHDVSEPGRITLSADIPIEHSTWLALRSSGDKLDEIPFVLQPVPEFVQTMIDRFGGGWSFEGREEFLAGVTLRPSLAHTGAIFVDVDGRPPPTAPGVARRWLAILDDFEARLADDRIGELEVWDWIPYSDAVTVEHVRGQRPRLLESIAGARARYEALSAGERDR